MPKKVEVEASNLVTLLTPRFRAIYYRAVERANEKSKAEFGESIYARGLRDWAQSKGLDAPPERWPCGFTRVGDAGADGATHSWRPLDWNLRPIGEPWQFKFDPADDGDLVFNVWGDISDDCVWFDFSDPAQRAISLKEYFENLGAVLDATVDPQRYAAILMRLPRGRPTPPSDAGAAPRRDPSPSGASAGLAA
jgi:hypothetical protein